MLSIAALSTPMLAVAAPATPMMNAAPAVVSVFSPSKHPFMKRVLAAPTHFSFDPYKMFRTQLMAARAPSTVVATSAASPKKVATPSSFNVSANTTSVVSVRVGAEEKKATATFSFRVVTATFKQGAAKFRAPFRVAEGDTVIVEGDRGEHIATIKAVHPASETEALAPTVTAKIIRRATAADLEVLATRREKESSVLADVCKIAKDVRLNATVADVEYQFDNNKLTIYVERAANTTFVDFRKLQRTLFKMFHCRIWFVYMDELTN